MHFELSDEQSLMKDTLSRFFNDRYDLARRREYLCGPAGFSRENWQDLAQLGFTAVALPENLGGMGGNSVEMMVVMEELGYHGAVEPFAGATFAIAAALSYADDREQAANIAGKVASGELIVSPALLERGVPFDHPPATSARLDGDCYRLSGSKRLVPHPAADLFLISASAIGPENQRSNELFLVPSATAGLSQLRYSTVDGTPNCDLHFDDMKLPASARVVGGPKADEALEQVIATLAFACATESLGILRRLLEMTRDYLKSRVQFGKPLATKQVVRHRLAEMYMHSELARSAVIGATVRKVGSADWRRSVAAAKVTVNTAADYIGKQAVQLHGGMGVSDEYEVSHAYKRLLVLKPLFGDARAHSRYLGAMAA